MTLADVGEALTDPKDLVDLYRRMAFIRLFEKEVLALSRDGHIAGSVHTCAGQEAIAVGAVGVLGAEDRVLATYRGHGWALECGVPPLDLLAEICQRTAGINGGRGGSAHLCAPQYRLLGENSIVGAGVPIGTGVAMAFQRQGTGGVVLVSVGDGAMNQGAVHEGLVFAAAQRLPLVVVCENNGWSEMTPTASMVAVADLASRAAGYGIPGVVVDGCDPAAVRDGVREAVLRARGDGGPTLIEAKTVRLGGHYNRDIEHYRPAADSADAVARDPLARLRDALAEAGVAEAELDEIDDGLERELAHLTAEVLEMPAPSPDRAGEHVYAPAPPVDEVTDRGSATTMTYQRSVNAALSAELERRPEVLVYGEDVGYAGGIFGVTRGLQKQFGVERVFDTPISESAILGSAVGASMAGMRPVVEIMWADFLLVALDQLVNQAANVRYVSRGELTAPMVVRTQQGATPGSCAQHSQSLEALLAHVPGLKVGLPSTVEDAYAMTRAAVADPDPVILIESRELYQQKGEVFLDAPVEQVGGARLHRTGSALSIITWGAMLHRCLAAAEVLGGVSVLDLRWLRPLDDEALAAAVRASGGNVLVVHEATRTGGFGAEVAARIQDAHFDDLVRPVGRLATSDSRLPPSPSLVNALVPGVEAIVAAAQPFLDDAGVRREQR